MKDAFFLLYLRMRVIKTIHSTVQCVHKEEEEERASTETESTRAAPTGTQWESEYVPVIAGMSTICFPLSPLTLR
jgi:hypothetical protein